MRRIRLPNTPLECSVLGFGCVSLTLHDSPERAVALLNRAFDAGITHFDVARLYGFGQAEGILGRFLQGKRDRVTVATKFGLAPSTGIAKSRRLVSIARWVAHRSKVFSTFAKRYANRSVQRGAFSPADAEASLETSLQELGTDHVDAFLLHECTLSDALRDDLIAFLNDQIAKGRIRCSGTATKFESLQNDAALFGPTYRIMQFDSDPATRNIERLRNSADRALITYGAVAGAKRLADAALALPALAARHSPALGIDPADASALAGLMLRDAVAANPEGVVLFATTRADALASNVGAAVQPTPSPAQRAALAAFVTEALAAIVQGPE